MLIRYVFFVFSLITLAHGKSFNSACVLVRSVQIYCIPEPIEFIVCVTGIFRNFDWSIFYYSSKHSQILYPVVCSIREFPLIQAVFFTC